MNLNPEANCHSALHCCWYCWNLQFWQTWFQMGLSSRRIWLMC